MSKSSINYTKQALTNYTYPVSILKARVSLTTSPPASKISTCLTISKSTKQEKTQPHDIEKETGK